MEHCKSQYEFDQEAASIASEIFSEVRARDTFCVEDCDTVRDLCQDQVHETVDGHQWVIYYYQSLQLCANVSTDNGEEWLEGCYETPFEGCKTFAEVHTRLAYATLLVAVENALSELIDNYDWSEAS